MRALARQAGMRSTATHTNCMSSRLSHRPVGRSGLAGAGGGRWGDLLRWPTVVPPEGPRSGSRGGDLVAVNLGEVVGHHQQAPLGAYFDPASPLESVDAVVVFGVAEQRLDGLCA